MMKTTTPAMTDPSREVAVTPPFDIDGYTADMEALSIAVDALATDLFVDFARRQRWMPAKGIWATIHKDILDNKPIPPPHVFNVSSAACLSLKNQLLIGDLEAAGHFARVPFTTPFHDRVRTAIQAGADISDPGLVTGRALRRDILDYLYSQKIYVAPTAWRRPRDPRRLTAEDINEALKPLPLPTSGAESGTLFPNGPQASAEAAAALALLPVRAAASTRNEYTLKRLFSASVDSVEHATTMSALPAKSRKSRNHEGPVDLGKPALTEKEAASALGVSRHWLSEKRLEGKIPERLYRRRCEGGRIVYVTKFLLLWLEEPGNELLKAKGRKGGNDGQEKKGNPKRQR